MYNVFVDRRGCLLPSEPEIVEKPASRGICGDYVGYFTLTEEY